jgi:hypothetical protein
MHLSHGTTLLSTLLPFWTCIITLVHWDLELFSSSNHISPLLNRPQGCQGFQKNLKDLKLTTMICFTASFLPKMNELHKNLQNQQKLSKFAGLQVRLKTSNKTDHGCNLKVLSEVFNNTEFSMPSCVSL